MNKGTPKENNSDLSILAKELVEKNGQMALNIAQRKIDFFPKDQHCREKDSAFMLLSEVEKLTVKLG